MNNSFPIGLLRTLVFTSAFLCFVCLCLLSSPTGSRVNNSVNRAYRKRSEQNERLSKFERKVTSNNCDGILSCNIVEPDIEEYLSQLPGVDDSICSPVIGNINLRPPQSMPFRALASFPRSGNTWTRSLLQIATNIYTTSVYWEGEGKLPRAQTIFRGNLVDYKNGQGVCTKTHEHDRETIKFFREGAILLIRNPVKSAVSDFLRCGRDHNRSEEETIQLLENNHVIWRGFLRKRFQEWSAMAVDWINKVKRLLIVHYEDVKDNPIREVLRMVTFLQQPVDLLRIRCAVYNFPPTTKNQTFLVPHVDEILKHYVLIVNETLIARNARPLPAYDLSYIT